MNGFGGRMLDYTLDYSIHLKREAQGFLILRQKGEVKCCLFCHFINPVEIVSEGKLLQTASNACYICTPGQPLYYKATPIYMLHNFIHFHVSSEEEFAQTGIPLNRVFYTDRQEYITRTVEYLGWAKSSGLKDRAESIKSTMTEFFLSLAQEQKGTVMYGTDRNVVFDDLRSLIYRSPGEWNVTSMANYTHLSRSHFSIKYRENYGVTPNEDLINAAIILAKKLLNTTRMPVGDVAEECGFTSSEYFIRLFKTRTGSTPGIYRKKK